MSGITVFSVLNEWILNSWRHRALLAFALPSPMNLSLMGAKWTGRWGSFFFQTLYRCWSMSSAGAWDWLTPTTFVRYGWRSWVLPFAWTSLDHVRRFPGGSRLLSVLCQIVPAGLSKAASSWDWVRGTQSLQPKWHCTHTCSPELVPSRGHDRNFQHSTWAFKQGDWSCSSEYTYWKLILQIGLKFPQFRHMICTQI